MSRPGQVRILVIDDEEAFLEELKEMLCLGGYEVFVSGDTLKVTQTIAEVNPDILLIDLKMAPKSGFQVAGELRGLQRSQPLTIIAMSGYFTEKEHRTLMHMCGITSFLTKPIKPLNLIAEIEMAGHRSFGLSPAFFSDDF